MYGCSISQSRFLELGKIITELFPHEQIGTWYIPYHQTDSGTQSARGTLTNCYNKRRATLRKWGILKDSVVRNTTQISQGNKYKEKLSIASF